MTCANCGQGAQLTDLDHRLRQLLAQLPLAPLRVLAPFVDSPASTLHRHVKHLVGAGLIGGVSSPLPSQGRPRRLLFLSRLGLTSMCSGGVEPSALARKLASRDGRAEVPWLPGQWPGLLAAYELLSLLAAGGQGSPSLCGWEWPCRRIVPPPAGARNTPLIIRLPAAAAITWTTRDGQVTGDYVLVPDTGGMAMSALRGALGHLAASQPTPTLGIATTTPRRAAGWQALLESVCSRRGRPTFQAEIATWAELRRAQAQAESCRNASRESRPGAPLRWVGRGDTAHQRPARLPLPVRSNLARNQARLGQLDHAVLELIARHPFLPTASIGDLVGGHSLAWARARRATLMGHDLVRVVPADELVPRALARLGLLEATHVGLEVVADQMGLPLMAAVRHHGLAGGGPDVPRGPRAALLRHLPHTLGADRVFAALARGARAHPAGGALVEWRGPAACAHGRLRPDGYGLLRLNTRQFGFFLEFDRGSMHADRLRAKFAAYHRYAASGRATRSYAGFPTILVVCTSPGGEQRIARAIAASEVGHALRLLVLLTTTGWLESAHAGPLGPVWRTAVESRRRTWVCGPDS